jgi:hypothetical protein
VSAPLLERIEIELRNNPRLARTFDAEWKRDRIGNMWIELRVYADTFPDELRALADVLISCAAPERDMIADTERSDG